MQISPKDYFQHLNQTYLPFWWKHAKLSNWPLDFWNLHFGPSIFKNCILVLFVNFIQKQLCIHEKLLKQKAKHTNLNVLINILTNYQMVLQFYWNYKTAPIFCNIYKKAPAHILLRIHTASSSHDIYDLNKLII